MVLTRTRERDVLGHSALRPDGAAKVKGDFAFSSDLWAENMLWGATLRSPHPHARIVSIDLSKAWKVTGVEAIITAADVPGQITYGLISEDQPVFAFDVVRYMGEPIAAIAANGHAGRLPHIGNTGNTGWIALSHALGLRNVAHLRRCWALLICARCLGLGGGFILDGGAGLAGGLPIDAGLAIIGHG